jgi:hypothetical protein
VDADWPVLNCASPHACPIAVLGRPSPPMQGPRCPGGHYERVEPPVLRVRLLGGFLPQIGSRAVSKSAWWLHQATTE